MTLSNQSEKQKNEWNIATDAYLDGEAGLVDDPVGGVEEQVEARLPRHVETQRQVPVVRREVRLHGDGLELLKVVREVEPASPVAAQVLQNLPQARMERWETDWKASLEKLEDRDLLCIFFNLWWKYKLELNSIN